MKDSKNWNMAQTERVFRTDAIILRRQDFKEYDRLVTLFTPLHGKFTVIAKGVRKPTGRMTGHVELFTRSSMLIARGRDLDILTQAELSDPFMPIRENLECAAYASYIVELLDRFTEPEEQNAPLFDLLSRTLGWLAEPGRDLRLVARYYELYLLRLVGYQPDLFQCVLGHESIEAQDQFFSAFDGGVVCPEHAEGSSHVLPVSLIALKTLRYLQTREFDAIRKLRVDAMLHLELERLLQHYIVYLLERRLKSVEFIRRLRHQSAEE
jgi:DNA repair protein RecO (recombination protein O)